MAMPNSANAPDRHRTYMSDIERGKRNPSISIIEKRAKTLGVSCGGQLD
jgi:transcriptional regulator with XRE-family HTH domain